MDGKELKIPNSVEGVVALNLTSYASGTNPWKNSRPAQVRMEWSVVNCCGRLLTTFLCVGVGGAKIR